jgi:methylated-DNA-protein-cysteine methyltransferase related protein
MKGRNARVAAAVRRIPPGRVATYGQIAAAIGLQNAARQVGYALHELPQHSAVPWHRVINARGEVSRRSLAGAEFTQRMLLEREGVRFNSRGRVDFAVFGWRPRRANPPASAPAVGAKPQPLRAKRRLPDGEA